MVKIWKTCVDAYEAHLVVTREDGRVEPWPHFQRPPADLRYEARSEAGRYPQGYISRVEATKACKNAGKRLCSLGEWRRACQGKRWLLYGYGPKVRSGHCNSGKDHLLSKLYGNNGRAWKYDEHFNNPELNQMEGFLARSGEYAACTAGEGVHDMVGNLHEWVSDTLDEALMERLEKDRVERRKQPMREGNGLFVGGFFSTTNELGPGCMYVTAAHEPSYHDYSTGFRCCKNAPSPPEPPKTPKTPKTKR
jgi:formylglycine-generating enzyme required for sulfatase activity